MNSNNTPLEITQYVDKLLEEKNLPDLDQEILDQMKEDLTSRVEDRINATLIANMDVDQIQRFNDILDENDEAKTQDFLKSEIPDLETVVASALINFRATYLGLNS